jgi:hypothetical protein
LITKTSKTSSFEEKKKKTKRKKKEYFHQLPMAPSNKYLKQMTPKIKIKIKIRN